MAWRRAIGAVKDQTSIGLAKVGTSNSLADLDVAIVKATRHEEYPTEEKHIREILSLTCYSRVYISACVNTISRRLSKTKNWMVALKTLMLIQRLLTEGDPAYEQEIFFATRRGTRLLNMSDFRDASRSNSWDYSAFVRTYSLYLDERLEFRMQGARRKKHPAAYSYINYEECTEEVQREETNSASTKATTPDNQMKIEQIVSKIQHLQQLLERFLATRPTGTARFNRIVLVALYPLVKESYQIYYDITDILSILIDRFMELEIPNCVKVYEIFCRVSKQFEELDSYYVWCKDAGIARSSEYPDVERITPKKLDLMDEFIRDKAANAQNKSLIRVNENDTDDELDRVHQEEDLNAIKALPPPEGFPEEEEKKEEETEKEDKEDKEEVPEQLEADLLHLGDNAPTTEEHADKLALALFDGGVATTEGPEPPPVWEAFNDSNSDWEMALVESASYLPHQKVSLGGSFDTVLLDGMYQHGTTNAALAAHNVGGSGSASSVALGSVGNPQMLALPAPKGAGGSTGTVQGDPFHASVRVPAPPYVQMSDMEKKQKLLEEEQLMWQQYKRDGMQGQVGLEKYKGMSQNMGGSNGYGYGYGY